MTDFASLLQADRGQPAHVLHLVHPGGFEEWLNAQPERIRAAAAAAGFRGKPGEFAFVPGNKADEWAGVVGMPEKPGPWDLAAAVAKLPDGTFRLSEGTPGVTALGWLLAQHRFDRYRKDADPAKRRVLLTPEAARIDETVAIASAGARGRDQVDKPPHKKGAAKKPAAPHVIT
ncbi:MAG: leucyl aminopeptidase family protein, partial [Sphingomonas oligoaromativorans]